MAGERQSGRGPRASDPAGAQGKVTAQQGEPGQGTDPGGPEQVTRGGDTPVGQPQPTPPPPSETVPPPPPPPPSTPGSGTPTTPVVAKPPCCCSTLLVYLHKIECVHVSAALGFITATSDEVAVTSMVKQRGGASGAKWPEQDATYPLDNGESVPEPMAFLLARIEPDRNCRIEAEVAVNLWKTNFGQDIKPVLEQVVGQAALIAQGLTGLGSLGQAMQALLARLYDKAGIGTTHIGDAIRLPFRCNFDCDRPLAGLLSAGLGQTIAAAGADACTMTRTVKRDPAEYKITLRIERDCEEERTKTGR